MSNTENNGENRLALSDPESVLAYIPHALGFQPVNSLVLMLLEQKTLGATLRVDLPKGADVEAWTAQIMSLVAKVPTTGVLAVVYSPAGSKVTDMPHKRSIELLAGALETRAIDLLSAWGIADGVWDYQSETVEPIDIESTKFHPVSIEMITGGSAPIEEPWDATNVVPWPNAELIREIAENIDGVLDDSLDAWMDVLQSDEPTTLMGDDDVLSALLLASLNIKLVRDLLPLLAGLGAEECADALDSLRQTGQASDTLSDYLLGQGELTPDWARIDRWEDAMRHLLGVASGDARHALMSMLGWAEWAKGRGSFALKLLNQVVVENDGYRLADLLLSLLSTGVLPVWATDSQRAWRLKLSR
ncbi:DUF4192 family protein [Glutamicibacter ardleyensis]|uniref:DUF4192 family protein n=1 Tax=Glutamicibacter ardleyensis TaxID=225894 RepID=UPI003FD2E25F